MAKRRKSKGLSRVAMVKEMARNRLGSPPVERTIPDRKRRKKEKHKSTLEKLLENE
jgi:hypothetical protein